MSKRINIFGAAAVLFLASCSGKQGADRFDWLMGEWKGEVSDITYLESWKKTNEEQLVGSSYILQAGDTVYRDKAKIEFIGESACYIIAPTESKEPVIFKVIKFTDTEAVFENNEMEFPKRVVYELKDKGLHVRFEGIKEGKNAYEEVFYKKK
jgi:hypothetical protein